MSITQEFLDTIFKMECVKCSTEKEETFITLNCCCQYHENCFFEIMSEQTYNDDPQEECFYKCWKCSKKVDPIYAKLYYEDLKHFVESQLNDFLCLFLGATTLEIVRVSRFLSSSFILCLAFVECRRKNGVRKILISR